MTLQPGWAPACVELLSWRSLARPPPDRLELYWRSAPSWWWFVWISVQVSVRLRSCAASSGSCVSRAAFKYHPHVFLSVVRFWASQLVRGTFWPHIAVTHLCKIYLRSFVHKQTVFTTRQQRLRASAWKELIIHTTWSCGLRLLLLSESNHLTRLSSLFIPHCFTVVRLQVENTCWQVRLLSCSGNRLYKTDGRSVVTCLLVKSLKGTVCSLVNDFQSQVVSQWASPSFSFFTNSNGNNKINTVAFNDTWKQRLRPWTHQDQMIRLEGQRRRHLLDIQKNALASFCTAGNGIHLLFTVCSRTPQSHSIIAGRGGDLDTDELWARPVRRSSTNKKKNKKKNLLCTWWAGGEQVVFQRRFVWQSMWNKTHVISTLPEMFPQCWSCSGSRAESSHRALVCPRVPQNNQQSFSLWL